MKEQRTEALKAEYLWKTQEKTKIMQDNLVKRMNKVVKKTGKADMQRSEKVKIIKEKKKDFVAQDTLD